MKPSKKASAGMPDRITLAAQFEDVEETDAGWIFTAWAQLYGIVNDRAWRFRPGSFSKTIAERVGTNRVKIHDGHNWSMDVSGTIGRVLSAEDLAAGCRYRGFLNREHGEVASKLADQTISENSVEVIRLKSTAAEVEIGTVPEQIRPFVEITTAGLARIQDVQEVIWLAVGLVSGSSQDRAAIIEPPTLVSFQDLPVMLSRWDPTAARQRVAEYARDRDGVDFAALARAHLVQLSGGECLGQIADVGPDGRLVVVAEALGTAYSDVANRLGSHLADPAAVQMTLEGAADRLTRYTAKLSGDLTAAGNPDRPSDDQGADAPAAHLAAEPRADTPEEPSTASTHSPAGSNEAAEKLRELSRRIQLRHLRERAGEGVRQSEPAVTSRKSTAARGTELV